MTSSKIVEKLRRRAIQNFMDILILTEIENMPLSGYDVIGLISQRFGILVSSGTVYSLLYSLERDGLVEGTWNKRKRIYKLTDKGKLNIKLITKANEEIENFLRNITLLNARNNQSSTFI